MYLFYIEFFDDMVYNNVEYFDRACSEPPEHYKLQQWERDILLCNTTAASRYYYT